MTDYDVVIVGAGFAGVTAARELSHARRRTLLIDARDRLGGRTWFEPGRLRGFDIEMGGGWVGDAEAYVMAEIERYDIPLLRDEGVPARMLWRSGDDVRESQLPVPVAQLAAARRALEAMESAAGRVIDLDFDDPTALAQVADLERPLPDLFEHLDLPVQTLAVLQGFWEGVSSGPWHNFSALSAARVIAAGGGGFFEYLGTVMLGPRFRDGTSSLIEAMIGDSDVDIRLSTRVSEIRQNSDHAVVVTDQGAFDCRQVICTVPINALHDIEFEPPLSPAKQRLVERGQPGRGYKLWMVATGCEGGVFCIGSPGAFVQLFSIETRDDETLLVAFGNGPAPDTTDLVRIQAMLHEYLPNATLLACDLHDWVSDPFAQGTWLIQSAGDITKFDAEMRRSEGRLHLAGSDYSKVRPAYIDGAIESAITTTGTVLAQLTEVVEG